MTLPYFPAGSRVVYQQLSARAQHYFVTEQRQRTGDLRLYRKAGIILTLYILSFVAILLVSDGWNWVAWLSHGLATALVGFNIMHDGAHESFSRSRRLNQLAALTFNLVGSNRHYWAQKHNRNHHGFTNLEHVDEDIDAMGLIRMSPQQPHYGFQRFQHLYCWILYLFTTLFWFFVLDYKALIRQKIGQREFSQRFSLAQYVEFFASKLLYLLLYVALPLQFLSGQQVLIGFLLMHAVLGFLFAVVFQMAHIMDQAEFPIPTATGELADEWAVHQLRTTVNFSPESKLLTWALGGLNYQTEHHLFPRISHVHYPALHQALKPVLAELGLSVRVYPTLGQALLGHYRHLRNLSHPTREAAALA